MRLSNALFWIQCRSISAGFSESNWSEWTVYHSASKSTIKPDTLQHIWWKIGYKCNILMCSTVQERISTCGRNAIVKIGNGLTSVPPKKSIRDWHLYITQMETKWTEWYAMTSHVIAYRSTELLFGTHTFNYNCFFDYFNCVFTQIRCLSRLLFQLSAFALKNSRQYLDYVAYVHT